MERFVALNTERWRPPEDKIKSFSCNVRWTPPRKVEPIIHRSFSSDYLVMTVMIFVKERIQSAATSSRL